MFALGRTTSAWADYNVYSWGHFEEVRSYLVSSNPIDPQFGCQRVCYFKWSPWNKRSRGGVLTSPTSVCFKGNQGSIANFKFKCSWISLDSTQLTDSLSARTPSVYHAETRYLFISSKWSDVWQYKWTGVDLEYVSWCSVRTLNSF